MSTVTFDTWASIVIRDKEVTDRQYCRISVGPPLLTLAIDRELRFQPATGGGTAFIHFFDAPVGGKLIAWWDTFDLSGVPGVPTGGTIDIKPFDTRGERP
jgi:hypothetical protein